MANQQRRFSNGVPAGRPSNDAMIHAAPGKVTYIWEAPGVSNAHLEPFNTRIVQELAVKMRWLCQEKGLTIQEGTTEAFTAYFEREARMLGVMI